MHYLHEPTLHDLMNFSPMLPHILLRERIEHKQLVWAKKTQLVTPEEPHHINISTHPVYQYRFAGEPSRVKYFDYITELLDTRGMNKRDLRNLCGKRLAIAEGDVHGEVLKGLILNAMIERERDYECEARYDTEYETYDHYGKIKARPVPRWWYPEKVETRQTLSSLTQIATNRAIPLLADPHAYVEIEGTVWHPQQESKNDYRDQLWDLAHQPDTAKTLRSMAGKLLICESSDVWYGDILKGSISWATTSWVLDFVQCNL